MADGFRPVVRDQRFLLPPSVDEFVKPDDQVRFVVDAVALLDLSEFEARYRLGGRGRRAYDPEMMVALLLWAFSNGVFSSRGIERCCESDLKFRFVTGNEVPDHATIARFRVNHEAALKGLHVQVLAMCAMAGLVRVGAVFLDGTKVAAPASKDNNRTMDWLDGQIAEWFAAAARADAADDDEFGDRRGDETPDDVKSREARLARLCEARDRLAAEQDAKGPTAGRSGRARRVNTTDPESSLLPVRGGWVQGYNAQAVATVDRVVIATAVTDNPSDATQLLPMIDETTVVLDRAGLGGLAVQQVVADNGYWSTAHIATNTAAGGPDLFIATGKTHEVARLAEVTGPGPAAATDGPGGDAGETAGAPDTDAGHDTERDARYQRRLEALQQWAAGELDYRQAAAHAGVKIARIYELRNLWLADPNDRLGTSPPPPAQPTPSAKALAEMRTRLATPDGQALYRQRSPNIEGVFADRKHRLGFRRFTRTGASAAASEWSLINTVGNLDKLHRALTGLTHTLAGHIATAS